MKIPLLTAAKAALKYVDDLNEDTPVDLNCKECVGRVYFDKGTPEPPLCWIHQLEAAVLYDDSATNVLRELLNFGVELDDSRLSYILVQLDRDVVETARKLVEGRE